MQAAAKLLLYEMNQHICTRMQPERAFSNAALSLCMYMICLVLGARTPPPSHRHTILFHAEGASLQVLRSKQGDNKENSSLGEVNRSSAV